MGKKPIVLGIGEYLWDCLPTGRRAGGAPVNFAYHASQHGTEGWAISAVGKDVLGDELERVTREHGIKMCVNRVDYPTGIVQVSLVVGQPTYSICTNVAWDHIPLSEQALRLAGEAAAICFGTLAQRAEESRATTKALLEHAPNKAIKVYDINLRQNFYSKEVIETSLRMSNVFKINDEELVTLTGMFGLDDLDTDGKCRYFAERYSQNIVILTGGDKFSSIYYDGEVSTIKTPKVKVVDTVGAGDAFTGAFVGMMLNGAPVREAHRAAVETSARVCTQAGAWIPMNNE